LELIKYQQDTIKVLKGIIYEQQRNPILKIESPLIKTAAAEKNTPIVCLPESAFFNHLSDG
jgi:hypothetical protein